VSGALLTIPHKAEIERSVLGVLFLAPQRICEVGDLEEADFFTSIYRKVYRAILELENAGKTADVVTVQEILSHDKELEEAGGIGFLSALENDTYAKAPLGQYCASLKEATALRRVLRLCESTTAQVADGVRAAEVLDSVTADFENIRESGRALERGPVHVAIVTKELAPLLARAADGKGQMIGASTGYADIDRLTAGWQSGDYDILAARPSAGKTAMAIEFALRQLHIGNPVAFFSLEMSREAILQRMICREACVDSQRFRLGQLSRDELKRTVDAMSRIDRLPLWIDDSAGIRATTLRQRLRSLAKRHGIKFAVVDYLQLLHSPGKDRFESVTNSSIELKSAAKELGQLNAGTLLALSQLNRAGATEQPRLEHLRESGQLEQDGDVIFLLYEAEEAENGQARPTVKILDIAKQRNGPCLEVRFTFFPSIGRFELAVTAEPRDSKAIAAGERN
jgi:replicative DNA helicase